MNLKTLQALEKRIFFIEDKPYIIIKPVKNLLRSTTLYEILTRGDYLCLNLITSTFTVLKQNDVIEAQLAIKSKLEDEISKEIKNSNLKKLKALQKEFQEKLDKINFDLF